jgi:hypothetical protein
MADDEPVLSTTQVAGVAYAGIGYIFGGVVGIATFIGAWAYCVMTYGFVLGLGLGWFPAAICAGIVGWATVLLWGPALFISVGFIGLVLIFAVGPNLSLVAHLALGAACGWLVWRVCPPWLRGK